MNDDLNLPPRAPLPVEVRDRIRATVVAGLAESPRPTRNRWYAPLAAAAGVVALAAAAVVVVTQTGDDRAATPPPSATPSTTDRFVDDCVAAVDSGSPAGEQAWTAAAFAREGGVGVLTIRNKDTVVLCEGLPAPNGALRARALVTVRDRIEPSDVPDLWLFPFSSIGMRPPSYPLILGGVVSGQANGMTLTLSDGTSVEADVTDETAIALVRWHGHSTVDVWTKEMTNEVMKELIVSVRVVDADGNVLYEGPPA